MYIVEWTKLLCRCEIRDSLLVCLSELWGFLTHKRTFERWHTLLFTQWDGKCHYQDWQTSSAFISSMMCMNSHHEGDMSQTPDVWTDDVFLPKKDKRNASWVCLRVGLAGAWLPSSPVSSDLKQESGAASQWLAYGKEGFDLSATATCEVPQMLLSIRNTKLPDCLRMGERRGMQMSSDRHCVRTKCCGEVLMLHKTNLRQSDLGLSRLSVSW